MAEPVTIPTLYARMHVCLACETCGQFEECDCPEPNDSEEES